MQPFRPRKAVENSRTDGRDARGRHPNAGPRKAPLGTQAGAKKVTRRGPLKAPSSSRRVGDQHPSPKVLSQPKPTSTRYRVKPTATLERWPAPAARRDNRHDRRQGSDRCAVWHQHHSEGGAGVVKTQRVVPQSRQRQSPVGCFPTAWNEVQPLPSKNAKSIALPRGQWPCLARRRLRRQATRPGW